jgi:hypothetical protein
MMAVPERYALFGRAKRLSRFETTAFWCHARICWCDNEDPPESLIVDMFAQWALLYLGGMQGPLSPTAFS